MDVHPGGAAAELADYFLSGAGVPDIQAQPHAHGGGDASTSVREFEYRGHRARIETTYRITIDGQPLHGHIEVLPSGAVHYHRFPQYAPASAVDVVRTVIDTVWDKPQVPDELADLDSGTGMPGMHMHGSGQMHGHGQMHGDEGGQG